MILSARLAEASTHKPSPSVPAGRAHERPRSTSPTSRTSARALRWLHRLTGARRRIHRGAAPLHGRLFLDHLRFPRLVDEGRTVRSTKTLILRIGPPNGIFAPYKASPEFLTLRALAGSGVPAPARLLVRRWGRSLRRAVLRSPNLSRAKRRFPGRTMAAPAFDDATRRELGGQFVAALAALHTFDVARHACRAAIGGSTDVARGRRGAGRSLGRGY